MVKSALSARSDPGSTVPKVGTYRRYRYYLVTYVRYVLSTIAAEVPYLHTGPIDIGIHNGACQCIHGPCVALSSICTCDVVPPMKHVNLVD